MAAGNLAVDPVMQLATIGVSGVGARCIAGGHAPCSGVGTPWLDHLGPCSSLCRGVSWAVPAVFGGIMIVTGPAVIAPLLRQAKLSHRPAHCFSGRPL